MVELNFTPGRPYTVLLPSTAHSSPTTAFQKQP